MRSLPDSTIAPWLPTVGSTTGESGRAPITPDNSRLLHIHFRDGKQRTIEHVDRCICEDGVLTGYTHDGRLVLRVLLATVDWLEVR